MIDTEERALLIRAPAEVMPFDELQAQALRLGEFYRSLMCAGTDYGIIPGTQKPTLLKPGAEMLRLWAGLSPTFLVDKGGTDVVEGIFEYQVKCSLYRDGVLVGEGLGCCNSLESKYRYRWVGERDLPPGVDKGTLVAKEHTNSKTGGKWKTYRLENDNPQDLANTILKMAKKRAFVDAILTATGASRIFTQDIEDLQPMAKPAPVEAQKPTKKAPPKAAPAADVIEADPPAPTEPTEPAPGRTRESITNLDDAFRACFQDFGLQPKQVIGDMGYKSQMDVSELPYDVYLAIKALHEG